MVEICRDGNNEDVDDYGGYEKDEGKHDICDEGKHDICSTEHLNIIGISKLLWNKKHTHTHTLAAFNFEVTVETVNKSITNIASIICLLAGLFARVSYYLRLGVQCFFVWSPFVGAIRREISIHDGVLVLCLLVRRNHPAFDIGFAKS